MTLHRTVCDVLADMRKLDSTKNYSSMLGLIEEVQFMVNQMESGLFYSKDINSLHKKLNFLEKAYEDGYEKYSEVIAMHNDTCYDNEKNKIELIDKYHFSGW